MTQEERYKHYYNEGYNAGCVKGYEQAMQKACEWLELFCSENYIMNYTDCCEIPTEQVIESFKKWMEGEEDEEDSPSQEPEETEKKETPCLCEKCDSFSRFGAPCKIHHMTMEPLLYPTVDNTYCKLFHPKFKYRNE